MHGNKHDYEKIIRLLKPFAAKNPAKANFQFLSTFTLLWAVIFLSYYFVGRNNFMLFITIPLTSALMCRSYVVEHDCGHLNFYKNKYLNIIAGNIMGFGILIPYSMWRFIHDSHHTHVGKLDKREFNPEVWTMTILEYKESPALKKLAYRFMRSRFNRMVMVPTINFGIIFRLVHPKFNRASVISVLVHDLLYVAIVMLLLRYIPFSELFFAFFLPLMLFYCVASFTLYGQHQFEDTYWEKEEEWDQNDANFKGSTCITAPAWYRWLVGNVLFHNVHHIMSSIPNYNMAEAEAELSKHVNYGYIHVTEVWRMLGLKVWDEKKKKLVAFSAIN